MTSTGWLKVVLAAVAAASLLACDSSGRAFEDLRLARLTDGQSTEQDVRKLFGAPDTVRQSADGKALVYPLGPEGLHTLSIKIDKNGKYQGREDLLTRANFAHVTPGISERDVLVLLGRPGRAERLPPKQEASWQWRFLDGVETRVFLVTFDARGTVAASAIQDDPRRFGGQ